MSKKKYFDHREDAELSELSIARGFGAFWDRIKTGHTKNWATPTFSLKLKSPSSYMIPDMKLEARFPYVLEVGRGDPPQQSDRSWQHRSPSCVNRWKNPENLAEKKVWSCGENFLWVFLVATEAATGAGVERTSPKSISCIAPFSELRWPILFSRKLTISPEWVLNGPYFLRVFWMLLTPRFNQLI